MQDIEVVVSIDLKNAYGKAKRSVCLKGAQAFAPRLASMAATEWSNQNTVYWQRLEGKWIRKTTNRGGWQGARMMQILFALGLEMTMRKIQLRVLCSYY